MNKKNLVILITIPFIIFGCTSKPVPPKLDAKVEYASGSYQAQFADSNAENVPADSSKKKKNEAEVAVTEDGNSPLKLMKSGKIEDVKASFVYKYDIDAADENGNTLLHMAAEKNDAELCKYLIQKGADPDLKNNESDTPLMVAIKDGCEEAANIIVELNPNTLFSRDAKGRTALDLGLNSYSGYYETFITPELGRIKDSDGQTIVHYFVKTKNVKGIRECANKGISVCEKDNYGLTPMDIAFRQMADEDGAVRVLAELILGGAEEMGGDYAYFENAVASRNYSTRLADGQTPLHVAAILGHNSIVNFLLENGADPSAQDSSGATPLHEAIRYGNLGIAKALLDSGANVNACDNLGKPPVMVIIPKESMMDTYHLLLAYKADLTQKDMFGDTVLHTVTMINVDKEIVEFLINNGADLNAKNKEGSTPLSIAVQKREVEIVKLLTDNGADIHTKNANGISPLFLALTSTPEVLQAIVNEKNAITQDSEGNTPLHIALINDASLSRVKYIVSQTGDVNIRNREGNSPLFITVLKNRKEVGELLLQKGADIFSTNINNNSPLRVALKYSATVPTVQDWLLNSDTIRARDGSGNTVLHYAVEWKYIDAINYLLSRNADVKAKNANGESVLFSAAKTNNPEIIQRIVNGGADLYARDNLGSTPIHMAVRFEADKSIDKLVLMGVDVNAQNTSGKSPLAEAVLSGKIDIAKVLLKDGADPNTCDISGVTILMDAIRGCNENVVRLLLKNGANPNTQDINGRNAYHEAAFMGDSDIIKIIRNAGGNPLARDKQGKTPLSIVMKKEPAVVLEILGNNRNVADSDGNTPLHIIVKEKGSVELLRAVIAAGFPLDARNSDGYTALNLAIEADDVSRAIVFLENGANPFQMIDKKGNNGVTIAMEKNNMEMIEKIVKHAGKKTDVQGNTILHYAAKGSPEEIVQYLVDANLDKSVTNIAGDTPYVIAERWKREKSILSLLKIN